MISAFLYSLIIKFTYLGLFLAGFISSATVFFPFPVYAIVFFSKALGLNPFLAGISTGIGSALGEITGYLIGYGGSGLAIEKKKRKWVKPFIKFFKKYGFVTIVVTAFLPFPFDIVGILSGWGKYDIKKFLIATSIGRIARFLMFAYTGSVTVSYLQNWVF